MWQRQDIGGPLRKRVEKQLPVKGPKSRRCLVPGNCLICRLEGLELQVNLPMIRREVREVREVKTNGFNVDHATCNGLLLVWFYLMHRKLGQM